MLAGQTPKRLLNSYASEEGFMRSMLELGSEV
jgi:hypothetical protein